MTRNYTCFPKLFNVLMRKNSMSTAQGQTAAALRKPVPLCGKIPFDDVLRSRDFRG